MDAKDPTAIVALLPLFHEKALSAAMLKHGIHIIKDTTAYLHPGQIPGLGCDCPLFGICKQIQWRWPDIFSEDKFHCLVWWSTHSIKCFPVLDLQ